VLLDFVSRYVVKDLVGSGTFGQVAKCFTEETNEYVAVKVIKNLPAYTTQARFEIGILHMVWLSLHDYLSRFFNPSLGLNLSWEETGAMFSWSAGSDVQVSISGCQLQPTAYVFDVVLGELKVARRP
jgi:hypothetical protein